MIEEQLWAIINYNESSELLKHRKYKQLGYYHGWTRIKLANFRFLHRPTIVSTYGTPNNLQMVMFPMNDPSIHH